MATPPREGPPFLLPVDSRFRGNDGGERSGVCPQPQSTTVPADSVSRLPPHVRSQIFSVLREGVRNAVQHSGADHVLIEFGVTQEVATGSVEDDGRGLQEAQNNDGGGNGVAGVGLRSMKERAALLGGQLHLLSRPGGGTRVEITVPLK